jgi:hypothetical protein
LELPFQLFQLTRPAWGATLAALIADLAIFVSIHAPRVGRDTMRELYNSWQAVSIHRAGSWFQGFKVSNFGVQRCGVRRFLFSPEA